MNAREVALNILNEVYTQQAYANISLSRHLQKNQLSSLTNCTIIHVNNTNRNPA